MTRRISPRSAIAAGDPDLARLATVDLNETAAAPAGLGRPRSLGDLARALVPASILADVPEVAGLGERLRTIGRRSG
jgi:hypothetical protein